jgi:hypothetical protein
MRALRSSQTSPVTLARNSAFSAFASAAASHSGRSASEGIPVKLRLKVRLTRGRLDRQIAAGHPYDADAELTLRARQLTDPHTQQQIARNLRGIIEYVDRNSSRRVISSVVIAPRAVRTGKRAILDLAEQLERAAAVNPRGIVLAQRFVTDGLSPLFNPHSELTVTETAQKVQDALEEPPTIQFDIAA